MIETEGKCCVHGSGHYEENLRVPLLVKLPGAEPGRDAAFLARHVDLLPTVLDLTGLDASTYEGPGLSLLAEGERESISYSEADGRCALRRALVTERYKYIYTPAGVRQALLQADDHFFDETCRAECRDVPTEELYDLKKDPFEKQSLLEGRLNEERAAVLKQLRLTMAQYLNLPPSYSESVVTGPKSGLDEEEQKKLLDSLRALGYIQ